MSKQFTPGGQDDDFGSCWRDTDLHTGVPILGQLSGQKLVQLGFEDAIWHKLIEKHSMIMVFLSRNKMTVS